MEMVSFGNEGVPAKRSKLDVGELGEDIFAPHGFLIVYLLASLAKIATTITSQDVLFLMMLATCCR